MNAPQLAPTRSRANFQLQGLKAMPCGCVAAAYRSFQWGVGMVSIEAKGPHCILSGHELGRVLELNDLFEEVEETEAPGIALRD